MEMQDKINEAMSPTPGVKIVAAQFTSNGEDCTMTVSSLSKGHTQDELSQFMGEMNQKSEAIAYGVVWLDDSSWIHFSDETGYEWWRVYPPQIPESLLRRTKKDEFTPTRWSAIPNPALSGWGDFESPCYDPQEEYGDCPPTLLDVLNDCRISINDRIWAFCNCILVPDNVKRLFGVRCVRETPTTDSRFVADLLEDKRSLNVLMVAEKYAHGEASNRMLHDASIGGYLVTKDTLSTPYEAAACGAVWVSASEDISWGARLSAVRAAKAAVLETNQARDYTVQLEIAKSFIQSFVL